MEMNAMIAAFRLWLEEHEIQDVEIEDGVGSLGNMAAISFPITEDEGYLSYDIVATLSPDEPYFFFVEYCDIPDVDELELYRFLNDLNKVSPLTVTAEDGCLCFSYSVTPEILSDADALSRVFFYVWDAIDVLRDDIADAFGIVPQSEEATEEESAAPVDDAE
jgi:hypothetical protein